MNVETPFIGGAFTARDKNLNAQVCQNFYVEVDNTGAKNLISLVGAPGCKQWTRPQLGGEVRNIKNVNENLYVVIDNKVYRVTSIADTTTLGTIGTDHGWVDIVDNGEQVCIFDGDSGWYVSGDSLVEMSLPATPSGAIYLDGFYIIGRKGTSEFYLTDDVTNWDALKFASKESAGDRLISVARTRRYMWLIGKETTEIWYNAGDIDITFALYAGGVIGVGCGVKESIATYKDSLLFLDNAGRVVMNNGVDLVPVSTYQIEYLISLSGTPQSSFLYHQEGHTFYELSFASRTICYDLTAGFWSTRASGGNDGRCRANCATEMGGLVYVGDYDNGRLYTYDLETYTDNGTTKRAIRVGQHKSRDKERFMVPAFELEMEAGVGNDDVADPQVMLSVSRDGGKTFSNERWRSIGKIGEYANRVRWLRLGSGRDFCFKVVISDAVKRNIINAYLDINGISNTTAAAA